MKNIFIIDEHISSKQNGFGTYLKMFLSIFKNTEHNITVLSANDDTDELVFNEGEGYGTFRLPIFANGNFFLNGELAIALIKRYIYDNYNNVFFVCHSPCSKLLCTLKVHFPKSKLVFVIHDQGWTAPLFGDRHKLEKLLTHNYISLFRDINYKRIKSYCNEEKKIYKYADKVICLSESTYFILKDIYKVEESKICLIPNGYQMTDDYKCTNRGAIREELGVSNKETLFLFVGRIVPAKGIIELLDAFEKLYQTHKDLRLVVAGQVFNHDELAKHNRASYSRILYTGLINKEELNKWYLIADVGVIPTYTEQCSYTALEMMAARLPVITTDGNGIKDMFVPNESALVVPAKQDTLSEDLAKVMEQIIHMNEEQKKKMTQKAYNTLQTKYSLDKMAKDYQKFVAELC